MNYFNNIGRSRSLLGSKAAAQALQIYYSEESTLLSPDPDAYSGVYLGRSCIMLFPVFLRLEEQINPHMMVAGITGSGKSFLMKAIIPRILAAYDTEIVILDFTGEYLEVLETVGARSANVNRIEMEIDAGGLLHIDLSMLKGEPARVSAAELAMNACIRRMRSFKPDSKPKMLVILDEAWKLVKSPGLIETMVREGRKYGVGLVMASQMLDDIEQGLFENLGTLFAFRLQNKESLERLAKNYNLSEEQTMQIQNSNLGSCMLLRIFKSRKKVPVFISRVEGVRIERKITVAVGDIVNVEISESKFFSCLKEIGMNTEQLADLKASVAREKSIELHELIMLMLSSGADRRASLLAIRSFGFSESDIADAFAVVCGDGRKG